MLTSACQQLTVGAHACSQMMGRAGRPQFDTIGIAVVMVHAPKKVPPLPPKCQIVWFFSFLICNTSHKSLDSGECQYKSRIRTRRFDPCMRAGCSRPQEGPAPSGAERIGNNLEGFKHLDMKFEAKIWPWPSYMCHIRSMGIAVFIVHAPKKVQPTLLPFYHPSSNVSWLCQLCV